jgi:succinyl-diaminopimelate desuccinylase
MIRLAVRGRAAHGSTPWMGDNAVLKGIDVFRRIETLPFAAESTEMFDRPSINLGRLNAGDAVNKVPDEAIMAIDIRYLPGQEPGSILEQIRAIPNVEVLKTFIRPPAYVSRANPYVTALCGAVRRAGQEGATGVGRDGASDAISFIEAGVPAVEFGPLGGGHHGPEEWVSIPSLERYRHAIVDFMQAVPQIGTGEPGLRAVEGGLA